MNRKCISKCAKVYIYKVKALFIGSEKQKKTKEGKGKGKKKKMGDGEPCCDASSSHVAAPVSSSFTLVIFFNTCATSVEWHEPQVSDVFLFFSSHSALALGFAFPFSK
ncbi:hypothetical protein VIGAN_10132200 [Vigna angularis var. angularis]|uniref:Uncharacterized protein n=1 Tax=Vigna angularis var. angularis TaxID=157739 RepID=A0A0S3T416_PHAAN|nr:hypothetical protein VIGAN_10131300 [Vigna angularis var. angularis]BAT99803.1 hypothetical protein VIGAN_10132200 [Vigna angularis var. angularis]